MKITFITASAGTGKTETLARRLAEALMADAAEPGHCRPEAVAAMTFTRAAAGQLRERCQARLAEQGRPDLADTLGAATFGTVHAVARQLVARYALALQVDPAVRVADEAQAQQLLTVAMGVVEGEAGLDDDARARLPHLLVPPVKFDEDDEERPPPLVEVVGRLVELAQGHGMGAAQLEAEGLANAQAVASLLPPAGSAEAIEAGLLEAIDGLLAILPPQEPQHEAAADAPGRARLEGDAPGGRGDADGAGHSDGERTKTTAADRDRYHQLNRLRGRLRGPHRQRVSWQEWLRIGKIDPRRGAAQQALRAAAQRHEAHPAFQADLLALTRASFRLAAEVVTTYHELKQQHGLLDYQDLERLAVAALARPEVQEDLREELDVVLVDEFQDTSPLQLNIFAQLAALAKQSLWVGDAKQAIYGFRGAEVDATARVAAALDRLAGAGRAVVAGATLTTNRRSVGPLVAWCNALFVGPFAEEGVPAEQVRVEAARGPATPSGDAAELWSLLGAGNVSYGAAAEGIAGQLALLAGAADRPPRAAQEPPAEARSQVAILCRSNKQCRQMAAALCRAGLEVRVRQAGLMATPAARAVVAALNFSLDPERPRHRLELLRWVGGVTGPQALADAALRPAYIPATPLPHLQALVDAKVAGLSPTAAVEAAIACLGLGAQATSAGPEARQLAADLGALSAQATGYEQRCRGKGGHPGLAGLLYHLAALAGSGRDTRGLVAAPQAVEVLTLHAAKGGEWPVVVVAPGQAREAAALGVLVEPQVLPTKAPLDLSAPLPPRSLRAWPMPYPTWSAEAPWCRAILERGPETAARLARDASERRRLTYVAMTRARDRLIVATPYRAATAKPVPTLIDVIPGLAEARAAPAEVPGVRHRPMPCQPVPSPGDRAQPPSLAPMPPAPRPAYPAATCSPSQMSGEVRVATVHVLGPSLWPTHAEGPTPPPRRLGSLVDHYLAAALSLPAGPPRAALADEMARRWEIDFLTSAALQAAADRLETFMAARWPNGKWRHEVPFVHPGGELPRVHGRIDATFTFPGDDGIHLALIDHKTPASPRRLTARQMATRWGGQMAAYIRAARHCSGQRLRVAYLHLPLQGQMAELAVDENAGGEELPPAKRARAQV